MYSFCILYGGMLIFSFDSRLYDTLVVPPVLFRTNYYSIEILHGVTAIILTYLIICCVILFSPIQIRLKIKG